MHPPPSLVKLQTTFGKILLGKLPSKALEPRERIEFYRSFYQGKLFGILHKHFPSLSPLVGYETFCHEIALPFGEKHYPRDWHIEQYGTGLTLWLKREGLARLSPLLIPMAELDEAFLTLFFPRDSCGFLKEDVVVIESLYPLMEIRKALLAGLPPPSFEKKKRGFVLYSLSDGRLSTLEVSPLEAKLLTLLKTHSLEQSLERLVQDPSVVLDSLESLLPEWSAKWANLQWISSPQELLLSSPH